MDNSFESAFYALDFRLAISSDLPEIVGMLADDALGATREQAGNSLDETYVNAFEKITADPNQELTTVELNGEIVGTFQLTFITTRRYPVLRIVGVCSDARGNEIEVLKSARGTLTALKQGGWNTGSINLKPSRTRSASADKTQARKATG